MRAALLQITSGDDPAANRAMIEARVRRAAADGAGFVLTPEVSNCVSTSRAHQRAVLAREADDATLARMREVAAELGLWLSLGSLALLSGDADGRFANRSFLIGPSGEIAARYDKMHMFDVDLAGGESYRESAAYRPGDRAVLARTPFGGVGLTVCYDLRFAALHRALAMAGADILLVPAAFARATGAAHWEVLLRARAIETGCYVLAAAQCGDHGGGRRTWGHSLAVSPWGEVMARGGVAPGTLTLDLDPEAVVRARAAVPSLRHGREIGVVDVTGPAL